MVIFDLDGTLSLVGNRVRHLQKNPKDWDSFFAEAGKDLPNLPIIKIFKILFEAGEYIKIITGRSEEYKKITLVWLYNHKIYLNQKNLHMRKKGDTRDDTIIKQEIIQPFLNKIEIVFEDRTKVVNMWRNLGITCLQVASGDF